MQDGRTRKVEAPEQTRSTNFLETHEASLTILAGPFAGTEFALKGQRQTAGRSPDVELRLDHASVSSEHAVFEIDEDGTFVRDLASTNGVQVNGKDVLSLKLEHGDRIALGECELQYIVESSGRAPKIWDVE